MRGRWGEAGTRNSASGCRRCDADVLRHCRRRWRAFALGAIDAAVHARQGLGIVRAQPGVGPITALSVAARIAKQYRDLLDPPPIPACLWRRRGAFRRRNTIEALARLECGVLQLN